MARYLLTDEAKEDLAGIRSYVRREAGARVAEAILTKISDAFVFLSGAPEAGHLREDLTSEPLKFWSVFSYLIAYDSAKRPIQITRVLHGSRDIPAILEQDDT